ncbi:Alpha/Beta hydrolase protein [Ilyonectria destructans]|nr:Alpha/Beta hydrolase protein [Ilyonectria destructans]
MASEFSIGEKLRLLPRLTCLAPLKLLGLALRSILISLARGLPIGQYLSCAVVRVLLGTFAPRQIQYLSPSTKKTYEAWIERKVSKAEKVGNAEIIGKLQGDIEPLEDGNSSLLWLGNRHKAKKVVLFLHGGGYVAPMIPGHLEWCWRTYIAAGMETNVEVAVAVLQYTLCPEARHPVQLRQAVDGLSHLLASGFHPEDIVVGGDSAGGNLTAQLLCHLAHPHPVVREVELSQPLAGSFLVSPWISRLTSHASYSENGWIDMLSGPIVDSATKALLGPEAAQQSYADLAFPLDGESSRFSGLNNVVSQLYVTTGDQEVFRDQGIAFVHVVRQLNPTLKVRFDVQQKCAHDFILFEGEDERTGECMEAMKSWMTDLLATSNNQ